MNAGANENQTAEDDVKVVEGIVCFLSKGRKGRDDNEEHQQQADRTSEERDRVVESDLADFRQADVWIFDIDRQLFPGLSRPRDGDIESDEGLATDQCTIPE